MDFPTILPPMPSEEDSNDMGTGDKAQPAYQPNGELATRSKTTVPTRNEIRGGWPKNMQNQHAQPVNTSQKTKATKSVKKLQKAFFT